MGGIVEAILIISLAVLCTIIPFGLGQKYGMLRLVSPMHLVAYFGFFGFLLKVMVYAVNPEFAFYSRFVTNPSGEQLGAIYLILFILLLCVGYRFGCKSYSKSDSVTAARLVAGGLTRRTGLFLTALLVTGLTIVVILRARGDSGLDQAVVASLNSAKQINVNDAGVGATLAGLKTFFVVPKFAFVLLLANAIVTGARFVMLQAGLLGILLVFIAILSGDRFELVELLIFALATHMILGGRLHGRMLLIGGASLAALAVTSAYMTQLRVADGAPMLRSLAQQIVGSTYFLDINVAIMVTDRVSADQMLLGQSYGWWSFGWVPRAFWFAKPAVDLGVMSKRDIMGVSTGGAFNVTGPGEAFINFRWAGIFVGFALGWLFRKGETVLLSSGPAMRHGAFFLYPMIFYPFVQAALQSSFSAYVVGAAAQLVLILAMIRIFVVRYAVWISPLTNDRSRLYVA